MATATTVLVPVDFSPASRAAIERALVLATARRANVRLLHALHLPPVALDYDVSGAVWKELRASETAKLEALRQEFEDRGPSISTSFEEREPTGAIHAAARAPDVQLIVMGSHGLRGLERFLLGSVAERTLQDAPVPVLIVRESQADAASRIQSILFATDFSESAQCAEEVVSEWAKQLRADVEVQHVLFDTTVLFAPYAVPDSRRFDDELRESAGRRMEGVLDRFARAGVQAKANISCGYASEEILKRAETMEPQMIAMGTRGHSRLRRYRLGSVVQRVVRHAPCGVLVAGTKSGSSRASSN